MCAMRTAAGRPAAFSAPRLAARSPATAFTAARRHNIRCRVLTESCDLEIGTKAPAFELPEPLTGKAVSLAAVSAGAKATLVVFGCVHCPFVVHLKGALSDLAKEYQPQGVAVVAISSNSVQTHPQDGPDAIAKEARELAYTFPYLYDETQDVAKAYKVACTPEFFVFDSGLGLAYHGAFDGSTPRNDVPITGENLRAALDAVLAGQPVPKGRPSIGCNLKWHPGNEPAWYGSQQVKK